MPVKIFCSYAREDYVRAAELHAVMRRLIDREIVELFIDRDIRPGSEWENELFRQLARADVVLLLVSKHFLASTFCGLERARARELGKIVLPVLIASCDEWTNDPAAESQAITDFVEANDSSVLAWDRLVDRIARLVDERRQSPDQQTEYGRKERVSHLIGAFPRGFITEDIDRMALWDAVDPAHMPPLFYHWRVGESADLHWIEFAHLQVLRKISDLGFPIELLINDLRATQLRHVHTNTQKMIDTMWHASAEKPKLVWLSRIDDEIPESIAFVMKYGFTTADLLQVRTLIGSGVDVDTMFDTWLYVAMYHARDAGHCILYVRDIAGRGERPRREVLDYVRDHRFASRVKPAFIYRPVYGKATGLGKSADPGGKLVIDTPVSGDPPRYAAILQWLAETKDPAAVADLAHYLTLGKSSAGAAFDGDGATVLDRASSLMAPAPKLRPRLESPDCDVGIKYSALALLEAMLEWNDAYFSRRLPAAADQS